MSILFSFSCLALNMTHAVDTGQPYHRNVSAAHYLLTKTVFIFCVIQITAMLPLCALLCLIFINFLIQVFFIMPFSRFKMSLEAALAGFLIVTPVLASAVVPRCMFTS
jgi:hypothetical protein